MKEAEIKLSLVKLLPEHAHQMHKLEKLCFSLPWNETQCRTALKQNNFIALGYFCQSRLVAYLSVYQGGGEMEIINLAVHPGWRRQGIGAKILTALLHGAAKMDIHKCLLEVREGNFAATSLYEKLGFRQCGTRKAYYPDTGEDALIYSRSV